VDIAKRGVRIGWTSGGCDGKERQERGEESELLRWLGKGGRI
jgi:hypothetical protein